MGLGVHLPMGKVNLPMAVVHPVLGLTKAVVHDLYLKIPLSSKF
jgi:hypothetical protein